MLVDGDCYEGATVTLTLEGRRLADPQTTNFFGEFKFDGLENGEYTVEVDAGGKKYDAAVTIDGRVAEPGLHRAVSSAAGVPGRVRR